MTIVFESYSGGTTGRLSGVFGNSKSFIESGSVVALFGTFKPATSAFSQLTELRGTFAPAYGQFSSGQLLAGRFPHASSFIAQGSASNAAVLFGTIPTAQWSSKDTQTTTLNLNAVFGHMTGMFDQVGTSILRGTVGSYAGKFFSQYPVLNYVALAPIFLTYIDADEPPAWSVRSTVAVAASPISLMTHVIVDVLKAHDANDDLVEILFKLTSTFALHDVVEAILSLSLSSKVTLHDLPTAELYRLMAIVDHMTVHPTITGIAQVLQLVASVLSLRDHLNNALAQSAHDTLHGHDAMSFSFSYYMAMLEKLHITAAPNGSAIITVFLTSGMVLDSTLSAQAQILMALRDGMQMSMTLSTGQDIHTAWVMTVENKAMRSYSNYPFNSFAELGGQFYGASVDGISMFGGETDHGAAILAAVRTGLTDFDTRSLKRILESYLGYSASGNLCLRVVAIDNYGKKIERTYRMAPQGAESASPGRIPVGKGVESAYFSFELDNNLDGGTFELYDITVLPMVLGRRV